MLGFTLNASIDKQKQQFNNAARAETLREFEMQTFLWSLPTELLYVSHVRSKRDIIKTASKFKCLGCFHKMPPSEKNRLLN